jgi:hypothetical protein
VQGTHSSALLRIVSSNPVGRDVTLSKVHTPLPYLEQVNLIP